MNDERANGVRRNCQRRKPSALLEAILGGVFSSLPCTLRAADARRQGVARWLVVCPREQSFFDRKRHNRCQMARSRLGSDQQVLHNRAAASLVTGRFGAAMDNLLQPPLAGSSRS
jgi:hypothetical protein